MTLAKAPHGAGAEPEQFFRRVGSTLTGLSAGLAVQLGGRPVAAAPLAQVAGEREVRRRVARLVTGDDVAGRSDHPHGDLVLTNLRLVFLPDELRERRRSLQWTIDGAFAPPTVARVVEALEESLAGEPHHALRRLRGLRLGRTGSWSGPTLIVRGGDGVETEIAVFASRCSPDRRADVAARDRVLGDARALLLP